MTLLNTNLDRIKYSAKTARHAALGGEKEYIKHLEDCISNPTIGLTARHKFINSEAISYKTKKNPTVKYLEGILKEQIDELYPKTKALREYIIESGRMRMFHISKIKPFTLAEKIKIALKTLIH